MKTIFRQWIVLLLWIGCAAPVLAQDSHPLVGNWIGYWGPDDQNRVLVTMDWDGEAISGTVNPGSDDLPFRTATLDPSDWSVHIEAEGRDSSGNAVTYVIDGQIEDLGSPHRSITGTWRRGDTESAFRITLQ